MATEAGGADVLRVADVDEPRPRAGEVLVRVSAVGVNFRDTYERSGIGGYRPTYPVVLGVEGAGTITALGGGDVEGLSVGQRVAWADAPGSYAESVVVRADRALPVADGVTDDVAAALPLQGMTAHYLTRSAHAVRDGEHVLVHAAAGGTGALIVQLAAAAGGRVIATTSSAAKERIAREAGAADVIRYTELGDLTRDLPAVVRELTAGAGVGVVYDGVGRDTFDASLASLARRGTLVLFGGSSGQVPPLDLQRLNAAGSLFVTRPTLADYVADPQELRWRSRELFDAAASGALVVRVGQRYDLADAARAHRDLQSRSTTGKLLLLP